MRTFGLIGKNISYSFSKTFFKEKFRKETIEDAIYELFDIENINLIQEIFHHTSHLRGLNVTIPYKQEVISFLTNFSPEALEIGAVNTIKITPHKRIGYNTDAYGFEESFSKQLKPYHENALILGTGGAAKAVMFTLNKLNIFYHCVSRQKKNSTFSYTELTPSILENYQIIINCSPIGTHPNIDTCPLLPYEALSSKHYLYDLVYNSSETLFLKKGREKGCTVQNGLEMFYLQANRSWEIWNS
ncbi:MAG: shikimate dehydrogenase family protein [Flavobacteriales bacterium Tduv]